MSKQDMVRAFCEYWGVDEKTLRGVGEKIDADVRVLYTKSLEACKTDEERAELEERFAKLTRDFGQIYYMVYMTACSYGVVNERSRAARSKKVAPVIA